ncbi:MAG: UDP-N-acetylmuramoyl-L-alanyl-D-glutamate--2,6-diaminopimelate ligase [Nitrospirae bacterium]|nr:UDP-N-acetylmuramoyl-L-alanyl-D-glutamate--2,6-diaminopimelate ligase [Nitrospirota bacterium]
MKLSALLKGIKPVRWNVARDTEILHLTADSRDVKRGSAFIAVRGTKSDGHQFLAQARVNGAAACIVETVPEGELARSVPWVLAPSSHEAMIHAARNFFGDPASQMTVVGVTGTNGKTTFTYLMEGVLESAGMPTGVVGTVNYRARRKIWPSKNTTPGAVDLQRMLSEILKIGAKHCVMEVSSHALDQKRADGIEFDIVVFTNLTQDHLDYHADMEMYGNAKRRLFTELLESSRKKRKAAVVNVDSAFGAALARQLHGRVVRYGWETGDVRVLQSRGDENGTQAVVSTPEGPVEVHSALVGRHNLYNILAAVAAGWAMGLGREDMKRGIARVRTVPGRMERVDHAGRSVWVDYAHTPDALKHVLLVTKSITPGHVTCVFGCGGDRDRGKRPQMGKIASTLADRVIITSDNPRSEDPLRIIEEIKRGIEARPEIEILPLPDRRQAIVEAVRGCGPGDGILLAGKGHEDYQIIRDKKLPFSDVAVAREALKAHAS